MTEKLAELVKSTKNIIESTGLRKTVSVKGPSDFVTLVDTKVQEYLRKKLAEMYPDIQFMGEEGEKESIDFTRPAWILDPIDGTTNFIYSYPAYCVSLGLAKNGEGMLGIVFMPQSDDIFCAARGEGAYLNGKRISVSDTDSLQKSLISVGTSPYDKEKLADKNFNMFKDLFMHCNDIRRSGSAAFDLCCLACGHTDGFAERNLKPWDYAAGCVIVQEAGGKVTSMAGDTITFDRNCDILASNGKNHEEIAALLNKHL